MVVKTQVCQFSENKIYPGKGMRIITRDGKVAILGTKKARAFFQRKTKGQVIRWTIIWRRKNKKLQSDQGKKERRRRAKRVVKSIVGLDKDEITRRQNLTQDEIVAQREKAIRELKERKRNAKKVTKRRK